METWLTPSGIGEAEFSEKRSRFIGRVRRVETEKEALSFIKELREKHRDASHNAYAYILRCAGVERYSDDGEPGGTAGSGILKVFSDKRIKDICCVVTRYFGGVLLGTGGLTRAYSSAAKLALEAAGTREASLFVAINMSFPYDLHDCVKRTLTKRGCVIEGAEFGTDVKLKAFTEPERAENLIEELNEESAGRLTAEIAEKEFRRIFR